MCEKDTVSDDPYCGPCFDTWEAEHMAGPAAATAAAVAHAAASTLCNSSSSNGCMHHCSACGKVGPTNVVDGEHLGACCAPLESEDDEAEAAGAVARGDANAASRGRRRSEPQAEQRAPLERERRMVMPTDSAWEVGGALSKVRAKVDKLRPADKMLYKTMLAHGWSTQIVLLPHQPEAVRFVAGMRTRGLKQLPSSTTPLAYAHA